jgi:hypothetical protein
LTAGIRRNGTSKFGLHGRSGQDGLQAGQRHGARGSADHYTGRHAADPRSKTARKRVGKAVPAAGVAAALVAGAAAYGLVAGSGHPQAAQLSSDLALPAGLSSAAPAGVSVGGVDSAASAMIQAARTAGRAVASGSAKAQASRAAKAAAKPTTAPSSSTASPAIAQAAPPEAAATASPSAPSTATSQGSKSSSSGGSAAVQSDIANGNYTLAIGQYLVNNGYSAAAAAGVASCVDGESGANPESEGSGGGGLIGWTPLGSAQPDANIITGNVSVDMVTQLADILYYNSNEIGQSAVDELNSQTDPVAAADFYSQNFEKPAVTDSDVRSSVAEQVYSELGG